MSGVSNWVRTTPDRHCPVCDSDSWCGISPDGAVARCMRIKSDEESVGSDGAVGWIHKAGGEPVVADNREPSPSLSNGEWRSIAMGMFTSPRAVAFRGELANSLGVTAESLRSLGVGVGVWKSGCEFASVPIRDWQGGVIGVSTRFSDGRKMCLKGSKNSGLFYPNSWNGSSKCLFVPEGASDVAAFISAGLCAVGRPSNTGGVPQLKRLLKSSFRKRRILVVGENDEKPDRRGKIDGCPKDCSGCGYCWPGKWGAERVAKELRVPFVMPPPGFKDFRSYWKSGSVWQDFMDTI